MVGKRHYKPLAKRLGAALQRRRLRLGLTQEDVAHEVDIPIRRYQTIEAGQQNVTLDTIARLSKTLRISPRELL